RRWRLSRTRVPRLRASRPGAGGSGDRQTLGSGQRLRRLAETLGGGKNAGLAGPLPPSRQGLGGAQPQGPRLSDDGLHPPHGQKAMPQLRMIPDRLLPFVRSPLASRSARPRYTPHSPTRPRNRPAPEPQVRLDRLVHPHPLSHFVGANVPCHYPRQIRSTARSQFWRQSRAGRNLRQRRNRRDRRRSRLRRTPTRATTIRADQHSTKPVRPSHGRDRQATQAAVANPRPTADVLSVGFREDSTMTPIRATTAAGDTAHPRAAIRRRSATTNLLEVRHSSIYGAAQHTLRL